eukprot:768019-Hanusia_phi.AAC.4
MTQDAIPPSPSTLLQAPPLAPPPDVRARRTIKPSSDWTLSQQSAARRRASFHQLDRVSSEQQRKRGQSADEGGMLWHSVMLARRRSEASCKKKETPDAEGGARTEEGSRTMKD